MTHHIHCLKLNKEAEGLAQPPLPGPLGQKIYENISQEAWQLWLNHQTMLINEHRLSTIDPKARAFLLQEMENFLFGAGSNKPAGFVNP
ncbi:MAG: oxidative damage protection protein [Gammaproteobacteria bacterium RIFCSPHIGHO2_12_FULL_37_14]|nr:MAG: oxidative damage protection protein [Gammaproteobacteria bacterium RIFCSPHIGHO2_12_FULL_37_14]